MKLAIVISTNEAEAMFNALRLGVFARNQGDETGVFLVGKAVEIEQIINPKFDIKQQARAFLDSGGRILACGTCLKLRQSAGSEVCPLSTMEDLYELIRNADRVVGF